MLAFSELAISKGVATKDEARSTTLKNIVTRWLNVRFLEGGGLEASPRADADGQCEFRSEPEGGAYRFIALRYEKKPRRGRPAAGSHSNNRGKDEAEFHLD